MGDAKIDAALADWKSLYEQLAAAQARLNALRFDIPDDRLALTFEVARLQRESEETLKAVQLQLDVSRVVQRASVGLHMKQGSAGAAEGSADTFSDLQ